MDTLPSPPILPSLIHCALFMVDTGSFGHSSIPSLPPSQTHSTVPYLWQDTRSCGYSPIPSLPWPIVLCLIYGWYWELTKLWTLSLACPPPSFFPWPPMHCAAVKRLSYLFYLYYHVCANVTRMKIMYFLRSYCLFPAFSTYSRCTKLHYNLGLFPFVPKI